MISESVDVLTITKVFLYMYIWHQIGTHLFVLLIYRFIHLYIKKTFSKYAARRRGGSGRWAAGEASSVGRQCLGRAGGVTPRKARLTLASVSSDTNKMRNLSSYDCEFAFGTE